MVLWCCARLSSALLRTAGLELQSILGQMTTEGQTDREREERLKPDVRGLRPEPFSLRLQTALFPTTEDRRDNRQGRREGAGDGV